MKDKREKLYLRRALAPYRGTLILLCALSSLSVLFGVGFAYAVKYLFPASEAYNVAAAIAVVAGFAAARVIFRTAYSYLSAPKPQRNSLKDSWRSKTTRSKSARICRLPSRVFTPRVNRWTAATVR